LEENEPVERKKKDMFVYINLKLTQPHHVIHLQPYGDTEFAT